MPGTFRTSLKVAKPFNCLRVFTICSAKAGPTRGKARSSSTVPGFAISAAGRHEVVLEGRHHFSAYALVFLLDPDAGGQTRLRAETRASFPGPTGGLYRVLVIGSRGHVLDTRRLLAAVRRRAEAGAG